MKKIILLALAAMMLVGCVDQQKVAESVTEDDFGVFVFDSCEYIIRSDYYQGYLAHKGNCRFCKERRKQELEQLKGK